MCRHKIVEIAPVEGRDQSVDEDCLHWMVCEAVRHLENVTIGGRKVFGLLGVSRNGLIDERCLKQSTRNETTSIKLQVIQKVWRSKKFLLAYREDDSEKCILKSNG